MKKLNPAHVAAVIKFNEESAFLKLISMRLTALETGGISRLELDLADKHMNPEGGPHGGVYATLIDDATWWAVYAALDEGVGHTTMDLHVDDLGRALSGRLHVEGRAVKMGQRVCLAEAFIRDDSGRLVVYGTSKLMVVPGRATIDDLLAQRGEPPLPPKFLED